MEVIELKTLRYVISSATLVLTGMVLLRYLFDYLSTVEICPYTPELSVPGNTFIRGYYKMSLPVSVSLAAISLICGLIHITAIAKETVALNAAAAGVHAGGIALLLACAVNDLMFIPAFGIISAGMLLCALAVADSIVTKKENTNLLREENSRSWEVDQDLVRGFIGEKYADRKLSAADNIRTCPFCSGKVILLDMYTCRKCRRRFYVLEEAGKKSKNV